MQKTRPTAEQLEAEVARFNSRFPVGTLGFLIRDDGSAQSTQIRSEAWVMGGHTAVIKVDGVSGGFLLSRFKPTE